MKLGVMTVLYGEKTLEDTLIFLKGLGVQAVELGGGGYPGDAHCKVREIADDAKKAEALLALVKKYGMEISAISIHNNPVHPDKAFAAAAHENFVDACKTAQKLGVDTIITFSGCPGDHDGAKYPNWVTCPWPDDYSKILEYQWNEVLIPYWKKAAADAKKYGVTKIALEMHPGFCVYNTSSLLRLRAAVGDIIGANFDPSHLFWQGIKPSAALKALKGAVHHFHAKDSYVDEANVAVNGVLDTKSYGEFLDRSWSFRTIGYGHDYAEWKEIMSTLRLIGYDGVISVEHEDGIMSKDEGLTKAVAFLKDVLMFEQAGAMWWA